MRAKNLQAQYDHVRSDFNSFKEETNHLLKNTVIDVGKLHRNMAQVDTLSKDNKASLEILQTLILSPEGDDTEQKDDKASGSPATKAQI